MRGTFVHGPIEWNLDLLGESWPQGSLIQGKLLLKNTSTSAASLAGAGVLLSYSEIKKIQSRDPKALQAIDEIQLGIDTLAAQEERSFPIKFKLAEDCGVSDSKYSLYIACGPTMRESQLQLQVTPHRIFLEVIKLLETFHRFKLKSLKSNKSVVEFKLAPPTSREMTQVEHLILGMKLVEKNLSLSFDVAMKTLDTQSVTTKLKKETKSFDLTLLPKEYSLGMDMINQDVLLKRLEDVLQKIRGQHF